MTETITDSFCERCGTRYTFEAAAKPRRARLGRVRVLTRGVTTFISNDGMPMAEALAAARSDEERADLSRQLDAFHKTFNFCMGCRQYTCPSCWNAAAGECLTCSPDLTREVLPAPFPDLPVSGPTGTNGDAGEAAAAASLAWPSVDLDRGTSAPAAEPEVEAAAVTEATSVAEPEVDPALPVEAELAPEPAVEAALPVEAAPAPEAQRPASTAPVPAGVAAVALAAATSEPADDLTDAERAEIERALAAEHEITPATPGGPVSDEPPANLAAAASTIDPATAGRDQTRGFLRRFRPGAAATVVTRAGDVAPDAMAVTESSPVAEPTADEPAPTALAASAAAAVVPDEALAAAADEPAPTPAAPATATPAPEPVAAEPEATDAGPEPPVEPAPRGDTVEQPTWRMVAPDDAAAPGVAASTAGAADPAQPAAWPPSTAWPPAPARDTTSPAPPPPDAAPWAARLALSRPETSGLWAASSREVLGASPGAAAPAPAAVQACVSCGLSLSATARFCRRCGSRQG